MKRFVSGVVFALAAFSGSGCTIMQVAPLVPDIVGSMRRSHNLGFADVYHHIERRNFAGAERAMRKLERETPTPLLLSELAYVRALIVERQGRTADAIALYRAVIAEHPRTPDSFLAEKKVQRLSAAAAK